MTDSSEHIPQSAYTCMTRDEDGTIVRLDTFLPTVASGETITAIDFLTFQRQYPDARLGSLALHVQEQRGGTLEGLNADVLNMEMTPWGLRLTHPIVGDILDGEGVDIHVSAGVIEEGAHLVGVSLRLDSSDQAERPPLPPGPTA